MTTGAEIKAGMMANFAGMIADGRLSEAEIDRMVTFEVHGLMRVGRVAARWCECDVRDDGSEAYYRRENGRHGWFHDPAEGGCGGITQTG